MDIKWPGLDYSLKHTESYQDLKYSLHRQIIDRLEEDKVWLDEWERERIARYVREHVTPLRGRTPARRDELRPRRPDRGGGG
jgi:hypothetical protein